MGKSWQIGVVRNIPIRIHWTFVLLPIIYAVSAGSVAGAVRAVVFILLLFACVVFHEFGHALAAQHYGITVREILLLPIGGLARLASFPKKPTQELIIAIAGPLVNIAIVVVLGVVLYLRSAETLNSLFISGSSLLDVGIDLANDLVRVNVFLALFNLIPAFPMDGGRVLRALLGYVMSFENATLIAVWVGRIVAGGFIIFGLFSGNIGLVLIAVFVFSGAGAEYGMVRQQAVLENLKVMDILRPTVALHSLDLVGQIAPAVLNSAQPLYPVMDGVQFEGVVTPEMVAAALEDGDPATPVYTIAQSPRLVVEPSMSLNQLYDVMASEGAGAILVLESNRPVGLVTAADLLAILGE